MSEKLLEVNGLKTYFYSKHNVAKAVDGVDFSLEKGEILGIIGESGRGKSVTVKSILQIVKTPGKIAGGEIIYRGTDLLANRKAISEVRGNEISMIFQEPMTALNPALRIGYQMIEGLRLHLDKSKKEAYEIAVAYLKQVKINAPDTVMHKYPHQLSGGMRQRVLIAMAISTRPNILLADEPTTALDVTIQQQIISLLKELKDTLDMSIIFITHDMGVINEITDNTVVMYCGKVMETAPTYSLLKEPIHPYSKALIGAIPRLYEDREELETIPGSVPSLSSLPAGCKFSNRCKYCMDICREKEPELLQVDDNRKVRCWKYES